MVIDVYQERKVLKLNPVEYWQVQESGLLTTYCVRYLHAVPFLRKKNVIFSTENSKKTCHLEESSILNALNLKK